MRKSETTNLFTEGLVMDINPIVTPNNVLCNALNATLITMNGNENVLQNDMGNGRVETAYLPEGYVPLGTTQLGGIIYIVSYNPLNNRCQIGSFPSPERSISSDEINDLNQTLQNSDFKYDKSNGALVHYLKKVLNDGIVFNPGDKFIVYGDTISDNFDRLYNQDMYTVKGLEKARSQTIKLDIGTITNTGKLVKFENLKQYKIKDKKGVKGEYHIFQYEGEDQAAADLDEYRSLVSQPYNIFNSKISGSLVLIAELVQFDDFDIQIQNAFDTSGEFKKYTPSVTFNFSGSYPFIPYGVICNLSLFKGDNLEAETTFDFTINDDIIKDQIDASNTQYQVKLDDSLLQEEFLSKVQKIVKDEYFNSGSRNEQYIIKYEFTPCMNWGPLTNLTVSGQIDLDKIGTGYINLSQWRYYNEPTKCSLNWGLEIYEEEGSSVNNVEIEFIRFINSETTESTIFTVDKKVSYFGTFYDILPIKEDYYKLSKQLIPNNLYLAKVKVYYNSKGSKPEIREFYRWLYTNNVFNDYYTSVADFQNLSLNLIPNCTVNYRVDSGESSVQAYGIIQKTIDDLSQEQLQQALNTKTSLSAIQKEKDFTISTDLQIGLDNGYNTFQIEVNEGSFNFNIIKEDVQCSSSSSIKYTDIEDSNQNTYLASKSSVVESLDELNTHKISETSGTDISGKLISIPTNVSFAKQFTKHRFELDNLYSCSLECKMLQTVKAYCSKTQSALSYNGKYIPLAYNRETFSKYNLEWSESTIESQSSGWVASILGLFGFRETNKDSGYAWIGCHTYPDDPDDQQESIEVIRDVEKMDFHWTTNPDIARAEITSGWSGTTMFFVHRWSGNKHDVIRYAKKPVTASEDFYSYAIDRHSSYNRVQLSIKANNGNNCFYPINFSEMTDTGKTNNTEGMRTKISKFRNLYNNFAQFLTNVYRYDQNTYTVSGVIPQYIYYMDECVYEMKVPISIKSTTELQNSVLYITLDSGKIGTNTILSTLIEKKVLQGKTSDYPSLENNIKWQIQPLNTTYEFTINDTDNSSGIELRNMMLNQMNTALGSALMDYDGKTLLSIVSANANPSQVYMRKDITVGQNVQYGITVATSFIPKRISYSQVSIGDDYEIVPSAQAQFFSQRSFSLSKYYAIDQDGLLVLNDPKDSDYAFIRSNNEDRDSDGTIDGYQNAWILWQYKWWDEQGS